MKQLVVPPSVLEWMSLIKLYAGPGSQNPILQVEEPASIMWSESYGEPHAVNPGDPSWGLMQCTFGVLHMFAGVLTAPDRSSDPVQMRLRPSYGYDVSHPAFDPQTNIKAGCGFLAHLKGLFANRYPISDPSFAWIAAYNEGEPNLVKHRPDPLYIAAFKLHMAAFGAQLQ